MVKPLSQDKINEITTLGKSGREAWQQGSIDRAEQNFLAAWDQVPIPKKEWDYAQSLSRGLVIFFRDTKQFDKAFHWLKVMRDLYDANEVPNPYVEFLSGTVHYENGDLDNAVSYFKPLYEQHGNRPFAGENKKYLEFTKGKFRE